MSQRFSSSPLIDSIHKFNECQIAEITYRVKYQKMVNHPSEHDSEILNLQHEQVEQWFDIAFEGYGWLNKQIHGGSKKMNQNDIMKCNIKLKNIMKARKRMETIKKKREIVPKDFKFAP
ncbi:6728_t:CDS:1, partial [Funneliformis caledonium]